MACEELDLAMQECRLSNSTLVLLISASWKKECKTLQSEFTSQTFGSNVIKVHINLDDFEEAEEVLQVKSIPTIRLYQRGQLFQTLENGDASIEKLNEIIRRLSQSASASLMSSEDILKLVASSYSATVKGSASCCVSVDSALNGYTLQQLAIAGSSNLGLGCGNPLAFAELKAGEMVVDLGSGAGIDCFIAGQQVGPSGSVIGIDMTPDMVNQARQNAQEYHHNNVSFRLGEIEYLPVGNDLVRSQ